MVYLEVSYKVAVNQHCCDIYVTAIFRFCCCPDWGLLGFAIWSTLHYFIINPTSTCTSLATLQIWHASDYILTRCPVIDVSTFDNLLTKLSLTSFLNKHYNFVFRLLDIWVSMRNVTRKKTKTVITNRACKELNCPKDKSTSRTWCYGLRRICLGGYYDLN